MPMRPPPLLPCTQEGYVSSSSSPSPQTAYSESLSSQSRRSSISTTGPPTVVAYARCHPAQRGSVSHESGSDPETQRSSGLKRPSSALAWCAKCDCASEECNNSKHKKSAAKSAAKTRNEQKNRRLLGNTLQNNEDLCSILLGYEVGTVQTSSNGVRSGLKGDKQANEDMTHAANTWLVQEAITQQLATGGHSAVEAWKAKFRDRLRAEEAKGHAGHLPSGSWMASEGDDVRCELAHEMSREKRKSLRSSNVQRIYRQKELELSPEYAHLRASSRVTGSSRTTSAAPGRR